MLSVEVNGPDGTPINEEVFQYLDDAEIIITHFAPVSRRMIEAAKNLKIIATLRTGMENINMEAAKERGIKVINVPVAQLLRLQTLRLPQCSARSGILQERTKISRPAAGQRNTPTAPIPTICAT